MNGEQNAWVSRKLDPFSLPLVITEDISHRSAQMFAHPRAKEAIFGLKEILLHRTPLVAVFEKVGIAKDPSQSVVIHG